MLSTQMSYKLYKMLQNAIQMLQNAIKCYKMQYKLYTNATNASAKMAAIYTMKTEHVWSKAAGLQGCQGSQGQVAQKATNR